MSSRAAGWLTGPIWFNFAAQAVSSLVHIAWADAQAITALRAMAKQNSCKIVAALCNDTSSLYQTATEMARSAPFSISGNKALRYAEWKAAVFRSYALCFTGIETGIASSCILLLWSPRPDIRCETLQLFWKFSWDWRGTVNKSLAYISLKHSISSSRAVPEIQQYQILSLSLITILCFSHLQILAQLERWIVDAKQHIRLANSCK